MVSRYQGYPEYKSAGVEWLDDIPSHWSVPSLKMLIDVRDGTHDTPSYVVRSKTSFPLVTSKDVTSGQLSFEQCKYISKDDYLSIIQRSKVDVGDILMPMIGTVGSPIVVKGRSNFAIKNLALFKTSNNQNINTSFLNYFLQSNECDIQFSLEARGGVQNFVSLGTLRDLGFLKAPNDEQEIIANFLDFETAKIDILIEKQHQLIKLLKEKRQAVISHAVTKGLNPDAPMRDSSVEWLGQIPAHWNVARFKYLISDSAAGPYGSSLTKSMYTTSGIRVYGQQQVIPDDLSIGDYYISTIKFEDMRRYEVFPNELLISVMGTVGRVTVVPEGVERGIINPRLVKYKVMEDKILPYFAKASILSDVSQSQLLFAAQGSTMDGLNMQIIGELPVPYPESLDEQLKILNVIKRKSDKFDKLLKKSLVAVELLVERRTALISAAVTGKIDVRNWQAPQIKNSGTTEGINE